jgi:hypothetical protein
MLEHDGSGHAFEYSIDYRCPSVDGLWDLGWSGAVKRLTTRRDRDLPWCSRPRASTSIRAQLYALRGGKAFTRGSLWIIIRPENG